VWTTHWWVKSIGYASSNDLKTWSEPRRIECWPADAKVANTWAPEVMYDDANRRFQIVWASTNSDAVPSEGTSERGGPRGQERRMEHRLYYKTTTDFKDFSDTKLFYDGGFSVIDGMIAEDKAGGRFVMVLKNETLYPDAKKNLHLVFGKSATGPFDNIEGPIAGPGAKTRSEWAEGPTLVKIGSLWHLYYDSYTRPQHLSVMTSPDLKEWTDRTADARFPRGGRHGTVFAAPRSKVAWLSEQNGK
jgi:beta-galactosidase